MATSPSPSASVLDAADTVMEWMRDSGMETDFMRRQLGLQDESPHSFSQAFQRVHGSPPAAPPQPQQRLPRGSRSQSRANGTSQDPPKNWPAPSGERAQWEAAAERMMQRHVSQDPASGLFRVQEVVERILEPEFGSPESEARNAAHRAGQINREESLDRAIYRYDLAATAAEQATERPPSFPVGSSASPGPSLSSVAGVNAGATESLGCLVCEAERAKRVAAEAELAQTMVWYRAHEASWHKKAEDWGKHAMSRLRKTTGELADARAQLDISRAEVTRLVGVQQEKENGVTCGIMTLTALRQSARKRQISAASRVLSRVVGRLGLGTDPFADSPTGFTSLSRDGRTQGSPQFLQAFFHNRSAVQRCTRRWRANTEDGMEAARGLVLGARVLRMHWSARWEVMMACGVMTWRSRMQANKLGSADRWKRKVKDLEYQLSGMTDANYRTAEQIMRNVAKRILHQEKASAIIIWQGNNREYRALLRGERILRKVGAKFKHQELFDACSNWQIKWREDGARERGGMIMRRVGARLLHKELALLFGEWQRNYRGDLREILTNRTNKLQMEIDSLQLKFVLATQGGAEKIMKNVAKRIMAGEVMTAVLCWRQKAREHTSQLRGERLMKRVGLRLKGAADTVAMLDAVREWSAKWGHIAAERRHRYERQKTMTRGERMMLRIGRKFKHEDWSGALQRWRQRAILAGLNEAFQETLKGRDAGIQAMQKQLLAEVDSRMKLEAEFNHMHEVYLKQELELKRQLMTKSRVGPVIKQVINSRMAAGRKQEILTQTLTGDFDSPPPQF